MTRRIALLSPYSGRNLGDGAVHVATIANLRALDPDLELIGLTVDTNAMLRLHGLSSITQTGMHGPFYYLDAGHPDARPRQPERKRKDPRAVKPSGTGAAASRPGPGRIPLAGPLLRSLREKWKWLWRSRHEPAHFVRSLALARKVDLILAIGGGQFDEQWGGAWGHPYTLFRWAMAANFTGKPFAMASVGVGILESKRGRDFVRRACTAAVYRSFRDPGSKAECMAWDFIRDDTVVPDIVLSLPDRLVPEHTRGARRRVGVSPMIFGREGIWPHERQGTYERYLGVLAEFVLWLMDRGEEVVFFTSCVDDYTAVDELWERVQALRPDIAGKPSPLLPSDTVEAVLRSLATVDLAVTSRLHATVLAHRCGCPVTAIAFERKVNAAMEFFAHDEYILDIFTVELEPLKQTYLKLAENGDALRAQIVRDIQAANAEIQKQNALILKLAGSGS